MKNHLSMELSIFSAGSSWLAGRGGSCEGSTRSADCWTVTLVLWVAVSISGPGMLSRGVRDLRRDAAGGGLAGDELLPGLGALVDDVHGVARKQTS